MSVLRVFNSIERSLLRRRISALVEEWRNDGKRILIYGAGFHTRSLLDITNLSDADIVGISDSDVNKHGHQCGRHTVIHPAEIGKARADVILISSKDCENEIFAQLKPMASVGVQIVRIYAGSAMTRLFKLQNGVLSGYERIWSAASASRDKFRELVSGSRRSVSEIDGQPAVRWNVELGGAGTWRGFAARLRELEIVVKEGGHTLYIPPQERLRAAMPRIVDYYPSSCGFKVLKNPMVSRTTTTEHGGSRGARLGEYSRDTRLHQITANYLHAIGLGPRLWDTCVWEGDGAEYTVFAVENVPGPAPSEAQCDAFMHSLRLAISTSHLGITVPGWEERQDFSCPGCNGNLIMSESLGTPQYVDFQQFTCAPTSWRRDIVRRAHRAFHFGDTWLDQRPLYQSVPAGASVGKRDTQGRWNFIRDLLSGANVDVTGRAVLDVGCNAGMMLHAALTSGAAWGIGWDRPEVVPFSTELLFSLGATRFQLIAADLHSGYPLAAAVPAHVQPMLSDAIVFYLSVRDHIGLVEDLKTIPWRALVYEGHQAERVEDSILALQPLIAGTRRIAWSGYLNIKDGDVDPRPIVLLVRD